MVFPVVMYGYECWTMKKAEHQGNDAFELWCWRRLMRILWTERRSNQSILKKSFLNIHWKDWWWSWSSSTLATWCEQLTHWKRSWCWERLEAGGEGDDRGWDGWMASLTWWTWVWASFGSWRWTGRPGMMQSLGSQRIGHWVTEPVCWGRLLRVPWTARRLNQSTLKELNPEYSLEGSIQKLKLQYFGYLVGRLIGKAFNYGKIEGKMRSGK